MLHHITLHLARCKDFPEGSVRHGYEIVAPLDDRGLLDAAEWREKRAQCRVKRFWGDEPELRGILVHRAGGSGGATWLIDYNLDQSGDDEAGYRLNKHHFVPGEYVSLQDEDEIVHTFQVVTVRPAEPADAVGSR